ncbi:RNA polymerase sigma-54 factor [Allochromatium warmingii]|uniref:RNA polymerase sigma-54 factor n=1 Tax=Allochromatium warmingii TaxID=61595 RepID=A0A1H3AS21_ALLWA|nr:RNA polymerase factor sigma-54 [Allochromatium warmingii]SDX32443.1 RNA polymerase sigma-54 factor [Allochromatium warmingii]
MKPSIQLRLSQQLTMTPQLQQAIKLLQLSTLELQQEIQEALDSNLMLEEGEESEQHDATSELEESGRLPRLDEDTFTQSQPSESDASFEREVQAESSNMPDELPVDTNWGDVFDGYLPPSGAGAASDDADYDPLLHRSRPQTLSDYLLWQLNLSRLNERDFMIAETIVDAIDADGYLRADVAELVATIDDPEIGPDEVETLIHRVQALDPAGVGARDPRECLLLQLRQLPPETPWRTLALAICDSGFEHLPRGDLTALARLLKADEPALAQALDLIRRLHPKPGRLIAETASEYVVPDIFVRKQDGRWQVELNPEITPKLRVNADYARLVRRADHSADGLTLKSHLQEARWFIKSLASRNETVLRVGAKIVEMQQDFLEHGEEGMRPLVLRDIAEALELHESTISRVTTHKYMHTPRGTFELKYFFSSHVNTTSGGECSSTAIRALIRKLIAGESPRKPLSDNKIAEELANQGIDVARRTVAKYREALGIPASSERKRLA